MAKKSEGKKVAEEPQDSLPGGATTTAKTVVTALPGGAKRERVVTMPSLVLKAEGQQWNIQILNKMRISNIAQKDKDKEREAATIANVGNFADGAMYVLLFPAVIKANLERDYPNHSYVGKCFNIKNLGKRSAAQRYRDYAIEEFSMPKDQQFPLMSDPEEPKKK